MKWAVREERMVENEKCAHAVAFIRGLEDQRQEENLKGPIQQEI